MSKEKFAMSGEFYFLDTNAIIQLLKGNQELIKILKEAEFIAFSIISKLEFMSFPKISEKDVELFEAFSNKIEIMSLILKGGIPFTIFR